MSKKIETLVESLTRLASRLDEMHKDLENRKLHKEIAAKRLQHIDHLDRSLWAQRGATTRANNRANDSIGKAAQWNALASRVHEIRSSVDGYTDHDLAAALMEAFDFSMESKTSVEIEYTTGITGKFFNPKKSVKEHWGIDIVDETDLAGLKLVLRSNSDYKDKITGISWREKVLGVHLKAGWRPLDEVIRFYALDVLG